MADVERSGAARGSALQRLWQRVSQQRLARHFAAFGVVILLAAMYFSYLIMVYKEGRLAIELAEQRADLVQMAVERGQPLPAGWSAVYRAEGDAETTLPEAWRRLAPGRHLLERDGALEHVVVRVVDGGQLYVRHDETLHRERIQTLTRSFVAVSVALLVVVIVTATAGARLLLLSRPALRRRLMVLDAPTAVGEGLAPGDMRGRLASPYDEYEADLRNVAQREREFIANVGHELRTPVTLVMTASELLAESPRLDDRDRAQLRRITEAAEHMSESIRSFMLLARDDVLGHVEPVDLRATVAEVMRLHEAEAGQKHLELQFKVTPGELVDANREALFVVINNLVRNAIKYTERGGVSVQVLGRTLYVVDTGTGVAPEDQAQLFLPFFRTRSAAESGQSGLGLGLAIVKRICDAYDWPLSLRSNVGSGSTFSVTFPPQKSWME